MTVDSQTGLEWLDLTATKGLSVVQILDNTGGWIDQGFRYASTSEVDQLFISAGFPEGGTFASTEFINETQSFQSLFGITSYTDSGTAKRWDSSGFFSDQDPLTSSYTIGTVYLLLSDGTLKDTASSSMWLSQSGRNSNIGHWLVKATPSVPEPSTRISWAIALVYLTFALQRNSHAKLRTPTATHE